MHKLRFARNDCFLTLLYKIILGSANLHVNVSLELTDEIFNPELENIYSEIFKNKSSWIETQVRRYLSHQDIKQIYK